MQLEKEIVYLLLGSNLGDREGLIFDAAALIAREIGEIQTRSSAYETAAWGLEDQPSFINIALSVSTLLQPLEVLEKALQIEHALGRVRKERWGVRVIDIDLIFYGDRILDIGERLQLPHPRMQDRRFVLEPMNEIAGDFVHPVLQQTVSDLLNQLNDNLKVTRIL